MNEKNREDESGASFVGVSVSFLGVVMMLTLLFLPVAMDGILKTQEENIEKIISDNIQKTVLEKNVEHGILNIYRQRDGRIVFLTDDHVIEATMLPKEALEHINMLFHEAVYRSDIEIEVEINKDIYPNNDYQLLLRQSVAIVEMIDAAGIEVRSYKINISEQGKKDDIAFIVGSQTNKKGIRRLFKSEIQATGVR